MSYNMFCSTEIAFGTKKELLSLLASLNQNIVLILSKSAAVRWELDEFIRTLKCEAEAQGLGFTWLSSKVSNPTPHDVVAALEQIGSQAVEAIVAVGGGSAIDLAKAISAFIDMRNRSHCGINH